MKPCGTYAAAMRHVRRNEVLDAACLRAQAEYMHEHRQNRTPAQREQERVMGRTRQAALEELRRRHEQEFDEILQRLRSAEWELRARARA